MRYFAVVLFDADVAAASQRGVHMLVGFGVRGHKVQQTLQECAHLYKPEDLEQIRAQGCFLCQIASHAEKPVHSRHDQAAALFVKNAREQSFPYQFLRYPEELLRTRVR